MPAYSKLGSLIDIVSQASMEIGIAQKPASTVVSSLDQDIIQMRSLLSAVASELLMDEPYKSILGDGYWIEDANGVRKDTWSADSDIILFDRRLAIEGVKYRFLKAKGLESGEELRDFSSRLNRISAEINGRVLDLDVEEGRSQ